MFIIKNIQNTGHVTYWDNGRWKPYREDAQRFKREPLDLAAQLSDIYSGQTYSGDENILS
jgi:hypothetical protein